MNWEIESDITDKSNKNNDNDNVDSQRCQTVLTAEEQKWTNRGKKIHNKFSGEREIRVELRLTIIRREQRQRQI